jgi:hypothetical protein
MVYTVKVFGQTVDMCDTALEKNKGEALREAESTFKDSKRSVQLFAVAADGTATLLRRK